MTIFDSLRYPVINWEQICEAWHTFPEPIRHKYEYWNVNESYQEPGYYDRDVYRARCMQKIRQLILEYEE